jgi:lipid-A-disaccharide synthase
MDRPNPLDLFIIVGEPSGDLHGEKLVEEIHRKNPELRIGAVAGPRMRTQNIIEFFPMEKLLVMGFIDILLALPKIVRQFFAIRKKILELQPKAVLCIDYPGFNLRLERSLRKKGYKGKVIHYICPTVWAWGRKRISMMEENLDLLMTIFPFEPSCFADTKLPVKYVGHPLASGILAPEPTKRDQIIAIFPGSRETEIVRNLPLQIATAKRLKEKDPTLQIIISVARKELEPRIALIAKVLPLSPPEENYDLMKRCHVALATSGTVNLELALHGTPTVVNFAIRPIDCFIAQKIFRIDLPFYCIVNIIASKRVFPELFGPNLTQQNFFLEAEKMTFNTHERQKCMEECKEIHKALSQKNSPREAVQEIFRSLNLSE